MSRGRIVITGGSRGIGAAMAVALAEAGYDIVGLSRTGGAPVGRGMVCDMTDEQSIRSTFASIAADGPILGLVNNAGIHTRSPIAELATADFEQVLRLNATSVLIASREAYSMLRQSKGLIVNIGSFFDRMGVPHNLAYSASKAAVASMTRSMAVEWAPDGISVVNVAPGYIETDLNRDYLARDKVKSWMAQRIPVQRPGAAEEVATFVTSLFVNRLAFLTGETIYIDGGQGINH